MYSYIFRYIPIHDICMKIGPQRSLALPVFHALTGCDQIASFYDHGKRSAWKVWEKNDDLTECFNIIGSPDVTQSTVNHSMKAVERFVCQLYKVNDDTICSVDEARYYLMHTKSHEFDKLPHARDTLLHHTTRTAYHVR